MSKTAKDPVKMSKDSIAGLLAAPINVATWNGTFQRAVALYPLYGQQDTYYELSVENTHHEMMEFVKYGGHFEVCLSKHIGCEIYRLELPSELCGKVAVMREAARLTDEEGRAARLTDEEGRAARLTDEEGRAARLSMREAIANTNEQLGLQLPRERFTG